MAIEVMVTITEDGVTTKVPCPATTKSKNFQKFGTQPDDNSSGMYAVVGLPGKPGKGKAASSKGKGKGKK